MSSPLGVRDNRAIPEGGVSSLTARRRAPRNCRHGPVEQIPDGPGRDRADRPVAQGVDLLGDDALHRRRPRHAVEDHHAGLTAHLDMELSRTQDAIEDALVVRELVDPLEPELEAGAAQARPSAARCESWSQRGWSRTSAPADPPATAPSSHEDEQHVEDGGRSVGERHHHRDGEGHDRHRDHERPAQERPVRPELDDHFLALGEEAAGKWHARQAYPHVSAPPGALPRRPTERAPSAGSAQLAGDGPGAAQHRPVGAGRAVVRRRAAPAPRPPCRRAGR